MVDFGVTEKKAAELAGRMEVCGVRESDLDEHFVRSSGPGGQKVNKSATCVYLRHIPTQIEVKMQKTRSQGLNRYYARKRLCELIEERTLGAKSPKSVLEAKIRKQKQRRRRRSGSKTES